LAIYIGNLLQTNQYSDYIDSIKSGSAQPNANAQQLTDLEIFLPSDQVLTEYFDIVDALERLKADNQYQSQAITATRDTLLPKLMNGEIAV
jgi:type I restriction enzyme, S subunit